ncbi:hypothetical protein, conserved [Eimeria praecox]|uniref:Uncharacterized protein n=1 Tax=Eimeria praecox TaxID=51316 RepID=U6GZD8_9EIME|nr:hypothetical protein, conserved [Eimeria praecox]
MSTAFIDIPTIYTVGIEALNPTHDPVYHGTLPVYGGPNADLALGPIQPPPRAEDIWLQVSRYGEGIALEDVVDYLMDQLPPHPRQEPSEGAPEAQPSFPEQQLREGPFWVVVEPSLAVATIEKIMNLHLLQSGTSRCAVVALVQYYVQCFIDERELSLPYLPKIDRGLFCFWKPAQWHL